MFIGVSVRVLLISATAVGECDESEIENIIWIVACTNSRPGHSSLLRSEVADDREVGDGSRRVSLISDTAVL